MHAPRHVLVTLLSALLLTTPALAYDASKTGLSGGQDCAGCDLAGIDLSFGDLQAVLLANADLRGAKLLQTSLWGALMFDARLQGADLTEADLEAADLHGTNFDGAKLVSTSFRNATLAGASFKGADITGANFDGATDVDLSGAIDRSPKPVAQTGAPTHGRTDLLIGSIFLVSFDFCPANSAPADGATIAINDNQKLYALYGNSHGGDGTHFKLPDLSAAAPVAGLHYCVVTEGAWPGRP